VIASGREHRAEFAFLRQLGGKKRALPKRNASISAEQWQDELFHRFQLPLPTKRKSQDLTSGLVVEPRATHLSKHVAIKGVSMHLSHSPATTTLDVYVHEIPESCEVPPPASPFARRVFPS
jgi:hypothetical protein